MKSITFGLLPLPRDFRRQKGKRRGKVKDLAKKLPSMYGPHSVDEVYVVQSGYIRVYALSRNGTTVHYVGRSNSDLHGS